jgi:hypothetical protein
MDVTIKIPDSLVKKIIISAIEYDAGWFWIRKDSEKTIAEFFEWDRRTNKLKTSFAEAVYAAFDAGHSIVVVELETEKLTKSPLNKESFKAAIYYMSRVHNKDYAIALYSELSGNHSAETSDKILQCTVFGEVLYSKKF